MDYDSRIAFTYLAIQQSNKENIGGEDGTLS